jgi:hypothetical protein
MSKMLGRCTLIDNYPPMHGDAPYEKRARLTPVISNVVKIPIKFFLAVDQTVHG